MWVTMRLPRSLKDKLKELKININSQKLTYIDSYWEVVDYLVRFYEQKSGQARGALRNPKRN